MIGAARIRQRDELAQRCEGAEAEEQRHAGLAADQSQAHQHDHDPPGADAVVQVLDHGIRAIRREPALQQIADRFCIGSYSSVSTVVTRVGRRLAREAEFRRRFDEVRGGF